LKVVVFARDCGGTTAVSTQVSVMDVSARFASKASWFRATGAGNVFVADTDHGLAPGWPAGGPRVDARWLDSKHLRIVYDKSARVFVAAKDVSDVTIEYGDSTGSGRSVSGARPLSSRFISTASNRAAQQLRISQRRLVISSAKKWPDSKVTGCPVSLITAAMCHSKRGDIGQ
jgi:hypothetical protein